MDKTNQSSNDSDDDDDDRSLREEDEEEIFSNIDNFMFILTNRLIHTSLDKDSSEKSLNHEELKKVLIWFTSFFCMKNVYRVFRLRITRPRNFLEYP